MYALAFIAVAPVQHIVVTLASALHLKHIDHIGMIKVDRGLMDVNR